MHQISILISEGSCNTEKSMAVERTKERKEGRKEEKKKRKKEIKERKKRKKERKIALPTQK